MLYKEFREKLKELGFDSNKSGEEIDIGIPHKWSLVVVYDDTQYDVYFSNRCIYVNPELRVALYDLVLEYAKTPVDKRREKKYNVVACRCKRGKPKNMEEDVAFYYRGNYGRLDWTFYRTYKDEAKQWTLEQIKEYGLEDCERIEIMDNEG